MEALHRHTRSVSSSTSCPPRSPASHLAFSHIICSTGDIAYRPCRPGLYRKAWKRARFDKQSENILLHGAGLPALSATRRITRLTACVADGSDPDRLAPGRGAHCIGYIILPLQPINDGFPGIIHRSRPLGLGHCPQSPGGALPSTTTPQPRLRQRPYCCPRAPAPVEHAPSRGQHNTAPRRLYGAARSAYMHAPNAGRGGACGALRGGPLG